MGKGLSFSGFRPQQSVPFLTVCEVGNGNTLQYSCRENSMDRGAWQATVHGGRKELDIIECIGTHGVGQRTDETSLSRITVCQLCDSTKLPEPF